MMKSIHFFLTAILIIAVGLCEASSPKFYENAHFFWHRKRECCKADLQPLFAVEWNEHNVNIKEVRDDIRLQENTKTYIMQHFGTDKIIRSIALMEIQTHDSFQELFFEVFLFNKSIKMHVRHDANRTEYLLFTGARREMVLHFILALSDENQNMWKFGLNIGDSQQPVVHGHIILDMLQERSYQAEIAIHMPILGVSWSGSGNMTENSGIISARLQREDKTQLLGESAWLFSAKWTLGQNGSERALMQLSAELANLDQSIFSIKMSSEQPLRNIALEVFSAYFRLKWSANLTLDLPINSPRTIRAESLIETLSEDPQLITPIRYLFGYEESNGTQVVSLRHNVSSPSYVFEGNMTVDSVGLDGVLVTNIRNKIRFPLSNWFKLDLRQIFHQSKRWNWETCVVRSTLADVHVSAKWSESVLDHYRKLFQVRSRDEELFRSMNLALEYSDRRHFHHLLQFPFEGLSYELVAEFIQPDHLLPFALRLLFRDEFLTNESHSLAQMHLIRDSVGIPLVRIQAESNPTHIVQALQRRISQVCDVNRDESSSVIMQLLRAILDRTSVFREKIALWLK